MTNKDLFKQAIAEAKTIREAAITNAKEALEESLTPHLKEMLAAKLQEMELLDEEVDETQDAYLEGDDNHSDPEYMQEGEDEEEPMEDEEEPVEDEEEAEEEPVEEPAEEEEDLDFENMTREDFKELLEDLMGEIQAEKGEEGYVDLGPEGDKLPADDTDSMISIDADKEIETEEVNIDELLAELDREEQEKEKPGTLKDYNEASNSERQDLQEAMKTIQKLRGQLQEVNLLNAKLLYVNKVFKSNNLSEGQKVNVIAAFDKAETVREVKLVFETVSKNVVAKKPTAIKEHKSFASKPTGTTAAPRKEVINEVSEQVRRMQILAGIIKQ
jgi:hypothetical protein